MAILAGVGGTVSSRIAQADREAELLFRGKAYRSAIKSYYEAGQGIKTHPRALRDLLKDPRFPNRRHIRALYAEPMAKDGKWVLLRAADGGIAGVASADPREPLKQANFPIEFIGFNGARSYADWLFEHRPAAATR